MSTIPKNKTPVQVTGLYLTEYDKVVKPQQRFLIPNYFINYWMGRLGPTLSWIIVSLQQACWRENNDQCTISQAAVAEEIGMERRTIGRVLRENPLRHWYIPEVEYQKGVVNHKRKTYQPLPNKYTVYLSVPLTPEHSAGLCHYLQTECSGKDLTEIEAALDKLLALKGKDALGLLEQHDQQDDNCQFEKPLPLSELLETATGLKLEDLPAAKTKELSQKLSGLHTHLTEIGYTNCRQYFRLNWVPVLGPSMAWLVMGLRSRCYYNPDSGEHRNICEWRKKELAALVGQSRYNLRLLLSHQYAEHFFQIIDNQKQRITVRVSMIQEPMVTESAADFWDRQSPSENVEKCDITPSQNVEKSDSTLSENVENCDIIPSKNVEKCDTTLSETLKNVTPPSENVEKSDSCKYFKESVPYVNKRHEKPIQDVDVDKAKKKLKKLLSSAGLSGIGLKKLCDKTPPLDLQQVQAVLLYAEANNLQPGYIYRHLELDDNTVDERFMQFAALDDSTLDLFRQAVDELRVKGTLFPDIQTPIPESLIDLFIQFAHAFTGVEPPVLRGALHHPEREEDNSVGVQHPDLTEQRPELDLLWDQVLEQLQLQMTKGTFASWLQDTRLISREGSRFTVAVKNSFAKEWLENRLFTTIRRTLTNLLHKDERVLPGIEIEFLVDGAGN